MTDKTMNVAVLADIHGVLPALETVVADVDAWHPDIVVVAGDVINRGPQPQACWDLVQQRIDLDGWLLLKGNHEEYVMGNLQPDAPTSGPQFETYQVSHWTLHSMRDDVPPAIDALPLELTATDPNGGLLRFCHASDKGTRVGIYRSHNDDDIAALIDAPHPAVLAVGHTHVPLQRRVNGTLVVNTGAVGMPFDGDLRAAYARLAFDGERWHSQIVRLPYNRDAVAQAFQESGIMTGGGPLMPVIYQEWADARPLLPWLLRRYQDAALREQIDWPDAVHRFLADYQQNGLPDRF